MSQAVNHLVAEYLSEEYPAIAKTFKAEAQSTTAPKRCPFGKKTLAEMVLAYRTHRAARAAATDSSSDDDEEAQPPRKAVKTSPKIAAKKAPLPDSSSDDDEPVRKPASRKASPEIAAKKAPIPDSSSDDDEPVRKPASRKASPKIAAKKAPIPDSSSDDGEVPVKKAVKAEAPATRRGPHNLNEDGTYRRFQRIDPTKVVFYADALRDNRPGDEHLVLRQNQEMMRVKGKGFNKLKQKNKGKLYGAGVDLSVRAYQFPDSDEE
jgi:hypothetical protein